MVTTTSDAAEQSSAWNQLKEDIVQCNPEKLPQTTSRPESEVAADALLAIYTKFAAKRLQSWTTELPEPGSILSWKSLNQFAANFRHLISGLNMSTTVVAMESDFCHGSCHSSSKGRSRR
jgi:hypothetical protein